MQRIKETIVGSPWLLFLPGLPLALIFSLLQTVLYAIFLVKIRTPGVSGYFFFELIYIFPLAVLTDLAFLCLMGYWAFRKTYSAAFAALFFLAYLFGIYFVLSFENVKYDLTDFNFRVVVGTLPSLVLLGASSIFIFLAQRKKLPAPV